VTTSVEDPVDKERHSPSELREAWLVLSPMERAEGLRMLERTEAEDLFFEVDAADQADFLLLMPQADRRSWIRMLEPDDAADVIQASPYEQREGLLNLLDVKTRMEVTALLAYAEDDAGGLMNPRYARVRPDMTVDEAISYLRKQARERLMSIGEVYALDAEQHLLGVVSFPELFTAQTDKKVRDVMHPPTVTALEQMDQEALSNLFAQHDLLVVPVVDAKGCMKGIVTVDDIVHVVRQEATEDIQKFGGMEALDMPYLRINIGTMIKKRAGWLSALFLGEMLTATAMTYFEEEIARAVVLALFVPLIISSGGNAGSQASTLVVRAMALGELRLRDWFIVIRRELPSGLALGSVLGSIGFLRIFVWHFFTPIYGEHYMLVAMTVSASLVGVVLFGSLAGAMLPLVLKRLGFDPASASAPFVATLVDVTGLIIYFTVASVILYGTLL
jgi:magnesium transporter